MFVKKHIELVFDEKFAQMSHDNLGNVRVCNNLVIPPPVGSEQNDLTSKSHSFSI